MDSFVKDLKPVSSSEYIAGKGIQFHPDGLFSESIFGLFDSKDRKDLYSYIELNCKVLHPAMWNVLRRLNRKILSAINKEASFSINSAGELEQNPDGEIKGLSSVIENFDKIVFKSDGNTFREDLIKMVKYYQNKNMLFLSKVLVIPAYYREAEFDQINQQMRVDPLNEYYVKIIRQSLQLQSIRTGEVFDVLATKMNNLVLDLYEYLVAKIGKKSGIIRSKVLGKRIDFSARAVISGGSDQIGVDQIGVPFRILVKIFEPFLLFDLLKSGAVSQGELGRVLKEFNSSTLSVLNLRNLFTGIYHGDEIPVELESMLKDSVNRVIGDKVVIAKRDPALHTESVQAFYPVMVSGSTIRLSILKCGGFSADFDGDSINGSIGISYGENKTKWIGQISELENAEV